MNILHGEVSVVTKHSSIYCK